MGHRPPDRAVLDEIRALAARLEISRFEALSTGIGIGELRPLSRRDAGPRPEPRATVVRQEPTHEPNLPPRAAPEPADAARFVPPVQMFQERRPPIAPAPRRRSSLPWLWAHFADLLVVLATLVIALMAVGYFMDPAHFFAGAANVHRWFPVRLFRELGVVRSLVALYSVFVVYWVFFRLFAGVTLGQIFFGAASGAASHQEKAMRAR